MGSPNTAGRRKGSTPYLWRLQLTSGLSPAIALQGLAHRLGQPEAPAHNGHSDVPEPGAPRPAKANQTVSSADEDAPLSRSMTACLAKASRFFSDRHMAEAAHEGVWRRSGMSLRPGKATSYAACRW